MRNRIKVRNEKKVDEVVNRVIVTEARHEKFKEALLSELGVSWDRIKSRSREREVVEARRYCYAIMRYIFDYTLKDIGRITNKHHSTVIHGLKTHDMFMDIYEAERVSYTRIKNIMLEKESDTEIKERIEFLKNARKAIKRKINELTLRRSRINEELLINKLN